MSQSDIANRSIAAGVSRLDTVLQPWGFTFKPDELQSSHTGPFASGHYIRGMTCIGVSFRETIDNIYYEHSFITEHPSSREIERFTVGHSGLMHGVGHADDCHLIASTDIPDAIIARDGGDRVDAFLYDLTEFAAPVLAQPCAEFFHLIRRGFRAFSVE